MASVLDGLLVIFSPECIVSPSLLMTLSRILMPLNESSLVSKRDAQSSTYISMCIWRWSWEVDEALWFESKPWCRGEWVRVMGLMLLVAHCF